MRVILQERDPKATVRLFKWLSIRRPKREALDPGDVINVKVREYIGKASA